MDCADGAPREIAWPKRTIPHPNPAAAGNVPDTGRDPQRDAEG